MKTVYFARHGQTAGNRDGEYQHLTIGLSDTGRAQAERLAKRLKSVSFDVLLASPMTRAFETAQIVAKDIDAAMLRAIRTS